MSYYKFPSLKFVNVRLEKGFSESSSDTEDEDMKYDNVGDAWS